MTAANLRLLLGNKYWYLKGGTEKYLFHLVEELPSHGYDPVPFAMKHPLNLESAYARYFVDEVNYDEPGSLPEQFLKARRILYSAHASRKLQELIREVKPDIAHFHNVYHQLSPSVLQVLHRHEIPVVMTLHDLKLACPNYKMRTHGEICERCVPGKFHHAVLRRCVRDSLVASALCATEMFLHRATGLYEKNVDTFIVPSDFYRGKMIESGIRPEQLVTIPTFTTIERYEPSYGPSDYFVYVGRLSEEKGLLTLLRAMRGFDKGRLVVLGEGPLRGTLEDTVRESRMNNVEIAGARYGQELIDVVRGARFTVVPSEWFENSPLSCVESFANGTPVVGANIGGIPEIVEDGETGLLFEPFSKDDLRRKMELLCDRDDVVERLGRNARRKAERSYSARAHLEKLLPVYASALERRRARAS